MRLLLHCCCGPCATEVAGWYREEGWEVRGWFYNPNIYPAEEVARRLATLEKAAEGDELGLLSPGAEGKLEEFMLALAKAGGRRCPACYRMRLGEAASRAAREGFAAFASTLSISPYQDSAMVAKVGREEGEKNGVKFEFADLRERYHQSQERSRELGLYRQGYCGCLFSKLERAERRARRAIGRALKS